MSYYEIDKMLTLSTAHISEDTANYLDGNVNDLVVYPKGKYGWFIYIDVDGIEEALNIIPPDLAHIINFARKNGFTILCFDRGGECLNELTQYSW